MPNPILINTAFAALAFEIGGIGGTGIVSEAHILPPGPFRATDGRPAEVDAWQLDAVIAAKVIARMSSRKNDTLIDYEHQSLRSEDNGQKVLAAGWLVGNRLEWREAKGLYAMGIEWTEDATEEIAAKQYRYISAVFFYDKTTGEVLDIVSIALTNTPALDGLDSLAALNRQITTYNPTGDNTMPPALTDAQIAALTTERDTANSSLVSLTQQHNELKTAHAALTTDFNKAKEDLAALTKAQADATAAAEKEKHTTLLQAALTDGRLTPAQKPWAEKQSLAALTEYLQISTPVLGDGRQAEVLASATANHGLNADELAMCTRMGVKPEDYAATKKTQQ